MQLRLSRTSVGIDYAPKCAVVTRIVKVFWLLFCFCKSLCITLAREFPLVKIFDVFYIGCIYNIIFLGVMIKT